MIRGFRAVGGVLIAGCASAPVAKMPFTEAFGTAPVALERLNPSPGSPDLRAALDRFSGALEAGRAGVVRGEKMGSAPAAAWTAVLAEVDRLLVRQVPPLASADVAKARQVLQAELTADAALYGDFPPAVAEGAQLSLRSLSARLALLAPPRPADLRRFAWPLEPVVVTSPFGTRVHPILGDSRFHSGVDLSAELAQPVRAAYDGTVVSAGWHGAYGNQIELQHDPHLSTRYGHLLDLLVADGARVKKGQVIALAGSTGLSTGVHLHFEVLKDGVPEDPEFDLAEPGAPPRVAQNGTSPGFPQSSPENPRF